MDRPPERSAQWLLAGEPEPAPKGWTTLSNVVRPLLRHTPLEVRPCPFERFSEDVPADAGMFGLSCAAIWAVVERCPTQAILTGLGMPHEWRGLLMPPPPGRRHDSANEHVALMYGDVGSGTADRAMTDARFGELVGRPVLLRPDEVIAALEGFGLVNAEFSTSEAVPVPTPLPKRTNAGGRPRRKREEAAEAMLELYPEKTVRPSWKVMAREVGNRIGQRVSPDTLRRAEGHRR